MTPISSFPVFCPVSQQVAIKLGPTMIPLLLGLSAGSKFYATTPSHAIAPLLTSAVSSFAVAGSFLIYTTSAHESIYIPLSALAELLETPDLDMREGGAEGALSCLTKSSERRRTERGSRIVAAIPSAMSLVLQMPRGNLETINPRPLVLEVVKSDIDQLVHRMRSREGGLTLRFAGWSTEKPFSLVENTGLTSSFLWNITPTYSRRVLVVSSIKFLRWITSPFSCPVLGEPSCLRAPCCLLLLTSGYRQSKSQAPHKIALLCDNVRLELEKRGLVKYMNCILTSYVVKTPPDYEAALSLMHRLRRTSPPITFLSGLTEWQNRIHKQSKTPSSTLCFWSTPTNYLILLSGCTISPWCY